MQIQDDKTTFYRPKWQLRTKTQPHPARRWCHTATTQGNHLYIMGGRLMESAKVKDYVYRINCETFQSEHIPLSDNPMMRESHSCALVNDSLYVLFGINKTSKVLNDCLQLKITPNSLIWQKKNQIPEISPRESHMSVVLDDRYILIYGGLNDEEKSIEQFYLYDLVEQNWRKIQKIHGGIQGKVGGTLINIKNQIYLFGGQINDENQYSNQIYKIQILHYSGSDRTKETQIQIFKLNPKGPKPLPRSQFASVTFKNRYLIILGGEGPTKDINEPVKLLSDIWVFDTQKMIWEQIIPENPQIFKPRSSFTANIYKQSLIVFGGLVSMKDFKSSDQIFILNLNTEVEKKPLCNLCKSSFRVTPNKQQIQVEKSKAIVNNPNFFTSFSMISAISRTIQNPFVALGTLLHSFDLLHVEKCAIISSDNKLVINLQKLNITDNEWKHILGSYEFVPLIQQNDPRIQKALQRQIRSNIINYLSYNIKNSCFRLGNELLISWINSKGQLQICLMNKFGVYHTSNVNCQNDVSPSQASIILQFLKEQNIDVSNLLCFSMSLYVTSLRYDSTTMNKKQIQFDSNVGDIVYKNKRFADYCKLAFSHQSSFELAIVGSSLKEQVYLLSHSIEYKVHFCLNQNDKWLQQNNYPELFEEIYTYEHHGNSIILVYQMNKLMHVKQTNSFQGLAIEFHLTKKIEPNITFSDVLPSDALIQAISTVVKHLSSTPLNGFKRNKSQEREQILDSYQKVKYQERPTKAVKKNECEIYSNGNEIEVEESKIKKQNC